MHLRRIRAALPHRLAVLPAVVLVVAAVLAGGTGLAGSLRREPLVPVAAASPGERSVAPGHGRASGLEDIAGTTARAAVRVTARPPSGAGTEGSRAGVALGAAWALPDLRAPHAVHRVAGARRHGASSPGQPASSPRAPPAA